MNERLVEDVVRRVVAALEHRLPAPAAAAPAGTPVAERLAPAPAAAALPADWPPREVAIGADHGGFPLKEDLRAYLERKGFRLVDCGTHSTGSVDYPDYAARVARLVSAGKVQAGIVIDGAGIGSGMAANKVKGVRCAVCHDVATVLNSRRHNDATVLSLGAGMVRASLARRVASLWLATACDGGRHLNRVRKILEIES